MGRGRGTVSVGAIVSFVLGAAVILIGALEIAAGTIALSSAVVVGLGFGLVGLGIAVEFKLTAGRRA